MDEYIRRGEAIEQFEDSTSAIPEKLARIRIKEIPAADVQPVRHGRWKFGICQECLFDWSEVSLYANVPNYCPNCGVRMDGGADK